MTNPERINNGVGWWSDDVASTGETAEQKRVGRKSKFTQYLPRKISSFFEPGLVDPKPEVFLKKISEI